MRGWTRATSVVPCDIHALGAFSNAAPLISTVLLVLLAGWNRARVLALACLLIVGGAVLAGKDVVRRAVPQASG